MWTCIYGPGRRDITHRFVSDLYSFLPACGRFFTKKERVGRIEAVIQKAVNDRDFLRAHHAQLAAARIQEVSSKLLDAKSEAT